MAIFATFQILFILRVLCVFWFFFFLNRTTQCDYWSLSLLFTAFYFQFCFRDTEKKKKKTKKLQMGTREWQI